MVKIVLDYVSLIHFGIRCDFLENPLDGIILLQIRVCLHRSDVRNFAAVVAPT